MVHFRKQPNVISESVPQAGKFRGLLQKLATFATPEGGCPYYSRTSASAEPTILAALALWANAGPAGLFKSLVDFALSLQNKDGSIGVRFSHPREGLWVTAELAILLHHAGRVGPLAPALDFIIATKSDTAPNDPRIRQDSTLVGWPWIPGTFGWVEPTAWALIALDLAGLAGHGRAIEGRKFLLDRQMPSGGWNYGNPGLNDRELLPFWDTTGLALVALCGHVRPEQVVRSVDLLEKDQARIESVCGLAWAVLGLQSHGRTIPGLSRRLVEIMNATPDAELNAAHLALGLIALSGKKVFVA
jgi:hypothetical protein